MTLINGHEIDPVNHRLNPVRTAIKNNSALEKKLHVIVVMSNPANFVTRYRLTKEFLKRMACEEPAIELYVVELAYSDQKFYITEAANPRHLQLRGTAVLWHKENMINLGVEKLLPAHWQAMAWIDADIEFESETWATDTLKLLNGCFDVVQLYSHACDLNDAKLSMTVANSFGYCVVKNPDLRTSGANFPHPGYAWAIRRTAYEKIGGLFENSILGSGDHVMAKAFMGEAHQAIHVNSHPGYLADVLNFEMNAKTLRVGYTPGVIRHYWHGSKVNRKYMERWQILVKHGFNPQAHLVRNSDGLLVPTAACPPELLRDIVSYGKERNEDEGLK